MRKLLCLLLLYSGTSTGSPVDLPGEWTEQQWQRIESLHIANLPDSPSDPSNAVLHDRRAIKLGKSLFFDRRLSRDGTVSCSHCHRPQQAFTDGIQHALGLQVGSRNTPSLLNTGFQDWFFWDGRADSLWAQALGPLENPNEHGLSRIRAVQIISQNPDYLKAFQSLFYDWPKPEQTSRWPETATPLGDVSAIQQWKRLSKEDRESIDRSFAQIGKVIAAYVATLKSQPSRFDRYVDAINKGDSSASLGEQANRGLALFIDDQSACLFCHSGPLLSNGDFQNTGTAIRNVGTGRSEVVEEQRVDRFNCLGENSDQQADNCDKLRYMNRNRHDQFGSFKVPGLRNVAATAPYMHDGRYSTLRDAIRHYTVASTVGLDTHLPEIKLTADEIDDLVAFLETLSEPEADSNRPNQP